MVIMCRYNLVAFTFVIRTLVLNHNIIHCYRITLYSIYQFMSRITASSLQSFIFHIEVYMFKLPLR